MKAYAAEVKALTDAGIAEEDAEALLEKRRPGAAPSFAIWEENWQAFEIFCALQTQWYSAAGLMGVVRTGLMYQAATDEMRERNIPRARRMELRADLRVMERAALETWNGQADSDG